MILLAVAGQLVADKVDWEWHLANFIRQNKERKVTIEEYCRAYELTYSTGRKKLNKKRAAAVDQSPKRTPLQVDHKRNDPPKTIPYKQGRDQNTKSLPTNELAAKKGGGRVRKSTTASSSIVKVIPDKDIVHTKKARGGTRFAKGNELGLVTGIGGQPREQDVQAALGALSRGDDTYLFETILRNESHKQLVERAFTRTATRLEAEIEAMGEPKEKGTEEDQQFGPPPDMVLLKMALEVGYYFNDHQSRIAAVIQARQKLSLDKDKNEAKALADRRKLNAEDLRLEMRQQELAEKQQERSRTQQAIADAIRMRGSDELDDIGVAEYIEVLGLKVPAFLAARAQKALDGLEPPISNDTTVDDDQIEREAEEHRRQRQALPQTLEERRAAVTDMVEQLGQGDIDSTGERKTGEFEDDDPDLDLDPSATADIYNDEPQEIAIDMPEEDGD